MVDNQARTPFRLVDDHHFVPSPKNEEDGLPDELLGILAEVGERWAAKSAPLVTQNHQRKIQEHPEWVFLLLWETVNHYNKSDDQTGYYMRLYLFGEILFSLRCELEHGRPWSKDLVDRIQQEIARYVLVPEYHRAMHTDFIQILQRSGLPIIEELKEANLKVSAFDNRFGSDVTAFPTGSFMKGLRRSGDGDVFNSARFLTQQMAMQPMETQIEILSFLAADEDPGTLEVLTLMLLHPETRIRRLTAELLRDLVDLKRMSGQMFKRLILLRNWLPYAEQVVLDRLIRQARIAQIGCAPLPQGKLLNCFASALDGSGEQAIWLSLESEGEWLGCRLIVSQDQGLIEVDTRAFSHPEALRKELAMVAEGVVLFAVDPAFLDTAMAHYMAVGLKSGALPPRETLQLAEWLGRSEWAPQTISEGRMLEAILAVADKRYLEPRNQRRILKVSANARLRQFTEGWFLQGEDVEICLLRHLGGPGRWAANEGRALHLICSELLEPERESWLNRVAWTALWLRAASYSESDLWQYFAVIAACLKSGKPVHEIPLLQCVAERTLLTINAQIRQYAARGKAMVVGMCPGN